MPLTCATTLTAEEIEAYGRDGFLTVRQLFDCKTVHAALDEAEELRLRPELVDPANLRCRFMPHADTGAQLFEVFDPVIDISPSCARMARDPRLLAILADLYGEPPCLFKDKLIYKPPGARGYGIHQDWIAWPDFPRSFLSVLIALDSATAGNGCTQVYPGVHRRGCLSPSDGSYHPLTAEQMDGVQPVPLQLQPGDAAIFTGFTPHFSEPNRSASSRRQLFLSYNAASDGGDLREAHYAEFHHRQRDWRAQQGVTNVYYR